MKGSLPRSCRCHRVVYEHPCPSHSFPSSPVLPLSSPPFFIGMATFQMFNRFVKIIPPRETHSVETRRGELTARERTINWTSPAHDTPGQGGPAVITFSSSPPHPPVPWPLPNAILFPGRLPWPVGPSATTEVAPAGIQAWNYERMGLPLPPVVPWPQMWNCHFFSPPFAPACRMQGGKDCIYHLSGSARTELREAGQHKIIIHKHEITKSLGTEQQNYFISEGGHSIF